MVTVFSDNSAHLERLLKSVAAGDAAVAVSDYVNFAGCSVATAVSVINRVFPNECPVPPPGNVYDDWASSQTLTPLGAGVSDEWYSSADCW